MDLEREAFIEGYKQRAAESNLIFDNTSQLHAMQLFKIWKAKKLEMCDTIRQNKEVNCYKARVLSELPCDNQCKDCFKGYGIY